MNIMIYSTRMDTGGVASVSALLANEWLHAGHQVSLVVFENITNDVQVKLDADVHIYTLNGYKYSKVNVNALRVILIKEKVDVVINQYGLPWIPMRTLKKAGKGLQYKVISAYHSDPSANARLTSIDKQLEKQLGLVKRFALKSKRHVASLVTQSSMRYVYKHSDAYVLLSESFFKKFSAFTKINNPQKLFAIPNPVTLESCEVDKSVKKEKLIIYVGRVDAVVKRVDRVIEVWHLLEDVFPDWRLSIIGDGDGLEDIKMKVAMYGLKHVSFEGFTNPVDYYRKASLLMLTSDFEGFGLVLVEGMSYGVVPVVYGSYDSVFDIVEDSYNGMIAMPDNGVFSTNAMVQIIKTLVLDEKMLKTLSNNALNVKKKFSKEVILQQWNNVFDYISK